MSERVIPPVRRAFRALARSIVPETREMDGMAWEEFEAIVERALLTRPAAMRKQLRLFVRILELYPILRYGTPFTRLRDETRLRFLEGVERSRFLLLRRGFWGLRTLILMGYYGRPAVRIGIGYRASPGGWDRR